MNTVIKFFKNIIAFAVLLYWFTYVASVDSIAEIGLEWILIGFAVGLIAVLLCAMFIKEEDIYFSEHFKN